MVPIPSEISNHGHIFARAELAGLLLSVGSWVLAEALILDNTAFFVLIGLAAIAITVTI
jgi:hypothetical protein